MISWRLHSFEIDVYAFILSLCDIRPASIVDMKKKYEKSSFKWTALIFISRNIFFTSYGEEPF